MGGQFETFKIIALIAFRNLFASRLKTLIVGGIIFFGAFLVVVGTSLLDSIDGAMSRSITGSVAGHVQVYSSKSKDPLEVMGSFDLEGGDITPLDDFAKVRKTLMALPNVKEVVPMGINGALVTSGNTIDIALENLRNAVRKMTTGDRSAAVKADYEVRRDYVQQIVSVVARDFDNVAKLHDEKGLPPEEKAAVEKASAPSFWTDFDRDPLAGLEFLENRIAPLATDADMLFLRYVGTDLDNFARSFDRMRIVDGGQIPRGERGFLFAKYTYEDQLKLKTARRLDKISIGLKERGLTIAKDAELARLVRENVSQVREIELQLDRPKTALFLAFLQKFFASSETNLNRLLAQFFQMSDENFFQRYDTFYKELAPHLQLYRIRIGDTLTIKAFTRSGYVRSVNLKVYGTFTFTGLESSPQAGQLNLMDLVSFRDLYGFLTDEARAEILELKNKVNAKEISRETAEADLFGSKPVESDAPGRTIVADATPGLGLTELEGLGERLRKEDLSARVYDKSQLETGVILNAAVILKDPKNLEQSIVDIEAAGKTTGLPLKAISWQTASGLLGQFVTLARIVLFTAVLIIFVVALVIINNALVMATLERIREIGTLRAIGAQRRFILAMLVIESLVVGVVFGLLGAGGGGAAIALLGKVGIAAPNDVAMFFFSGPRLFPALGTTSLIVSLTIVFLVSAISSFYPAFLAMRVSPLQAMQSDE